MLYLLRTRVVRDERRRLGDGDEHDADTGTPPGGPAAVDDVIDISDPVAEIGTTEGRRRRARARRKAEAEGVSIGAGPSGDAP